jgi:Secretion system C-terminal sorting domain
MKLLKPITLLFTGLISFIGSHGQNVSINILTQNSGQVALGSTVAVEVTICNTDAAINVPNYKLRPRISVPSAIVSIPTTGHTLPPGWAITANTGSQITLSNGTDQVPAGACRTILVLLQGNAIGGPSTVNGNLLFSNGVAPGTATGTATAGDASADNSSTSTVQVITSVPLTLLNFSAAFVNCNNVLSWVTENEQNTASFELERATSTNPSVWVVAGLVNASGNTNNQVRYSFTDDPGRITGKWLYRLKMIDRNGRYSYSPVIPVSGKCNEASVLVYPNPAQSGKVFVTATGLQQTATSVLKSVDGRIVYAGKIANGVNIINTTNISAGLYVLTVQDSEGAIIQNKVIVQ